MFSPRWYLSAEAKENGSAHCRAGFTPLPKTKKLTLMAYGTEMML